MKREEFYKALEASPIIGAALDEASYQGSLRSDIQIVFLLDASISNLAERVENLLGRNKLVFIHIDMIAGLNSTPAVVDYIADIFGKRVGIITTKYQLIKRAKQRRLVCIFRGFMVDSKSRKTFMANLSEGTMPDAIELLPAFVTNVIKEVKKVYPSMLVIAGGLIDNKKEIYNILSSGANGISTSNILLMDE